MHRVLVKTGEVNLDDFTGHSHHLPSFTTRVNPSRCTQPHSSFLTRRTVKRISIDRRREAIIIHLFVSESHVWFLMYRSCRFQSYYLNVESYDFESRNKNGSRLNFPFI